MVDYCFILYYFCMLLWLSSFSKTRKSWKAVNFKFWVSKDILKSEQPVQKNLWFKSERRTLVRLGNTRILSDDAQKSPETLVSTVLSLEIGIHNFTLLCAQKRKKVCSDQTCTFLVLKIFTNSADVLIVILGYQPLHAQEAQFGPFGNFFF